MGLDYTLTNNQMDVLVLAPFGKDSALIAGVLNGAGITVRTVTDREVILAAIPDGAGAAILAEEALDVEGISELGKKLRAQPPWSDFPIIVMTGGGLSTIDTESAVRSREPLGNVTLLERPLRAATLISSVRSALAARKKQYEIRDYLRERKQAEEELRSARDKLETIVEERTAALRRLSAQLLRVQDDERRRIARELHDSLGQYLAAAKINLDLLAFSREDREDCVNEVQQIIERAIAETRTLSHLLHPPSLDTAGFASAARWYVEGFAKRSGIEATLEMPEDLNRLPAGVETALFRIMQEALTNVHRHSGTKVVKISLSIDAAHATLVVKDFGHGIPKETLESFMNRGTNVGVGLAGIRERVKELGGSFELSSNKAGTTLKASIPIAESKRNLYSPPPISQIYSSFVT